MRLSQHQISSVFFAFWLLALIHQPVIALERNSPNLPSEPLEYSQELILSKTLAGLDTVPNSAPVTNLGATLGRVLFYDRSFSKNRLVRCATCHTQENGFDDPNRFSIGFEGKVTRRHAMGLANLRFNGSGRYFWDERAQSLEEQILEPFFDPIEMGLMPGELVHRAKEQPYYADLFKDAFGDSKITKERIAAAIAQFLRAMNSIQNTAIPSDFTGSTSKRPDYGARVNRGAFLFFNSVSQGGAACFSCHKTSAFVMTSPTNNGLDSVSNFDEGLAEVTKLDQDRGKFRAASLVNIAVRAPYMHDGRFDTLEAVVDHYSSGVKAHDNLDERLKNADGKPIRLNLSEYDKDSLVAYLQTLTDEAFLKDPAFSDPFAK